MSQENDYLKFLIDNETSDLILTAKQEMTKIAHRKISLLNQKLAVAKAILEFEDQISVESQEYIDRLIERIAILKQSELLAGYLFSQLSRDKHASNSDINILQAEINKLKKGKKHD